MSKKANGAASKSKASKEAPKEEGRKEYSPEVVEKVTRLRSRLHTSFAQVVMALAMTPRYRHLPLGELNSIVMDPLIRDRIAVASPDPEKADAISKDTMAGIAIWATVSDEVDQKIREQIKEGVFPVRLTPDEWVSGETTWLLDVVSPTKALGTAVLRNFAAHIQKEPMRLHPVVGRNVDVEELKKMGATTSETSAGSDEA